MTREQYILLVESTQKAFRRFLLALCCGDSQQADDIAQESYIKAYLACDGFENPDKFGAWIFRIGYNTFLNSRRSRLAVVDYDHAAAIPSADTADGSFRYQALYAALGKLPARERSSILLYYMQGYSVKEIADIEDVSADAVRQHLFRGRSHLRGLLSPQ